MEEVSSRSEQEARQNNGESQGRPTGGRAEEARCTLAGSWRAAVRADELAGYTDSLPASDWAGGGAPVLCMYHGNKCEEATTTGTTAAFAPE